MWSKNGTPVSTSDDAGAVEVELDDDVGFLGLAFDLRATWFGHCAPMISSCAVGQRCAGCQQRVVLLGEPCGGAQISGDADVADEDAGVEVALPGGGRVGELTEQHEVGVAGNDAKTHAGQRFCDTVTFGDQLRHAAERVVGVAQRGACGRLGDRRQVVRQPNQQHRVDHGGRGDQIAESATGERERLAHGAGDNQLGRVLVDAG